jgi:hypothetical protein
MDVAAVAGHKSFETARTYVHPTREQVERVAAALEKG